MAKQDDGYENALDSIYKLIFAQSKKSGKLKPIRPSELSASDQLAAALAEIAAKPATWTSNAAFDAINNSLGSVDLLKFWVGDDVDPNDDDPGKVNVKVKNLAQVIKDPRKFVDAAYKTAKEARAWNMAAGFTGVIDGGVAFMWAKKKGLSTSEAIRLGFAANSIIGPEAKELVHKMSAENAAFDVMQNKARAEAAAKDLYSGLNSSRQLRSTKIAEKPIKNIFNGSLSDYVQVALDKKQKELLSKNIADMSKEERIQYDSLVKNVSSNHQNAQKRYSELEGYLSGLGQYSQSEIKDLMHNFINRNEMQGSLSMSPSSYRNVLSQNILSKMQYLDPVADKKALEDAQKALAAVNMWERSYGASYNDRDFNDLRASLDKQLQSATGAGANALQDAINKIDKYQSGREKRESKAIWRNYAGMGSTYDHKDSKQALATFYTGELASLTARHERVVQSLNAVGLTASRKDRLEKLRLGIERRAGLVSTQIGSLREFPWANLSQKYGQTMKAISYYKENMVQGGLLGGLMAGLPFFEEASGIMAPGKIGPVGVNYRTKDASGNWVNNDVVDYLVTARTDLHPGYASLSNLYYFTPASIGKTLFWNGEGYIKAGQIAQHKLMRNLLHGDTLADINSILGTTFTSDNVKDNYRAILDAMASSNNPWIRKQYSKLSGLEKTVTRFGKLGNVYNKFSGKLKGWGKVVNAKVMTVVNKLLRGKIVNSTWTKAVDQFTGGQIGLRKLIQTGFEIVLHALDITVTGGTLSVVVTIVTYVATELFYAASKPLMELVFAMVWCVLALIMLILWVLFFGLPWKMQPYRHVVPATAAQCVDYNPHTGLFPEALPEGNSNYPPIDSDCPFGSTSLTCTQGPTGNVSGYHTKTKAIDIASGGEPWHAPTDGKVTYYKASNICQGTGKDYGGDLRFVDNSGNEYVLLHVKALVGLGAVKKGQAVAVWRTDLTPDGSCWTGPHYHLHTVSGGGYVDSLDWYRNKLKCDISGC